MSDNNRLDDLEIKQAMFVMKTLRDGWVVRMNIDGVLEFSRPSKNPGSSLGRKMDSREFMNKYR